MDDRFFEVIAKRRSSAEAIPWQLTDCFAAFAMTMLKMSLRSGVLPLKQSHTDRSKCTPFEVFLIRKKKELRYEITKIWFENLDRIR